MIEFRPTDGSILKLNRWLPTVEATGVLLIIHGVGEYSDRYTPMAAFMQQHGLAVYAPDLRGHGQTAIANDAPFGHLADHNGWERTVEDIHELVQFIRSEQPNLPVFLFGHSMGSLLARRFTQRFGQRIEGVIHSAASAPMGTMAKIGLLLAKLEIRLIGRSAMSKRMGVLLFGGFNRPFRPNRTPHDWISSDEEEVDLYMADTQILKFFSAALFADMIGGAIALNRSANMRMTPRELPLLFVSGKRDPLGEFSKGVLRTVKMYKRIGSEDLTVKLYEDARHELLQEYCREQVMTDIYDWIVEHSRATAIK
jgi:alpha-beta hydrolase superfamily lysophospholipase